MAEERRKGGGNRALHAFLRSKTANQLCQAGTPIPTEFLQAGTPASHKSLLGYYISTKKGLSGSAFRKEQEVNNQEQLPTVDGEPHSV